MHTYHHDAGLLAYAPPTAKLLTLGGTALVVAGALASVSGVPIIGAVGHIIGQTAAVAL